MEYAGTGACVNCHWGVAKRQQSTRMARAARHPVPNDWIPLSFSLAKVGIETDLSPSDGKLIYSVRRSGEKITGEVLFSMGDGEVGKTFVLETNGNLFESQLSYFTAIAGLDLTPGHIWEPINDLEHQFGVRLESPDARRCFSCHTTASTTEGRFDQTHAAPGVTCEACHGPGLRHAQAMEAGDTQKGLKAIFNPVVLQPVNLVDFCGACHRAPMDVKVDKDQSALNIRFQPYRLAKSRCWTRPDARLTCTACHSPHDNLIRDQASYDAKCLTCHLGTSKSTATVDSGKEIGCPVGTAHCVTCHMPRYQLPQLHGSFTDHFIRIVKPGEKFPL